MSNRNDMTCTTCGDVAVPESFIVNGVVSSSCYRCRTNKPSRCSQCFHQKACCVCRGITRSCAVIDEVWNPEPDGSLTSFHAKKGIAELEEFLASVVE